MSQDPFSRPEQYHAMHPPPSMAPRRTATWVYVAVILGILFLFMSLLIVAGSLLALNHVGVIGTPDVPATDGTAADMEAYVNGLGSQSTAQSSDAEIREWLADHADEPYGYISQDLPFDKKLFMQAVAQSPQATSLGIEARLTLVSWLDEYFPQPESLDHYSIVSTERSVDPTTNEPSDFAVVNLYFYYGFYEGFTEGMSSRWYLHKDSDGWKLYDTQRIELGRRTSDEWAHYLSNLNSPIADAYDESKAELMDTYDIDVIRKEEKRKVLPNDFPVKQLLVDQAYQQTEAYDEAVRVLDTITDPDMRWGVLTTKSHVLSAMGRYDEAIAAAEELLKISPNHPNGLSAICKSLEAAKRFDELRPYLARLVNLCPNDWNAMERFAKIATPDDLDVFLASTINRSNPGVSIEFLLDNCFDDDVPFPEVLKNWRDYDRSQADLPESSWELLEAAESFASGDALAAVQSLERTAAKYPESPAAGYLEDLISNATTNAYQWCDPKAMKDCDRLYTSVENPTLYSLIINVENNVRLASRFEESVASLIERLGKESESDLASWGYPNRYRLDGLFNALFRFGYLDEAEKLIDCISNSEAWSDKYEVKASRASLLLYQGKVDEVIEIVRAWESEDVSSWLSESQVDECLYLHPDRAKRLLNELLPDNPVAYWSIFTDPVVVFNRSAERPDESAVRAWVDAVIDGPFELLPVPTMSTDTTKGLGTWKVTLEDGLQLLISISDKPFDDDYVEFKELISTINSSDYTVVVEAVAVTVVEYRRKKNDLFADQALLWKIARQSVNDASLGMYSWRSGAFWECNAQSQEALRWNNGFPQRAQALRPNYITTLYEDATEETSVDRLTSALSTGKTLVRCYFDATVATELVDAELLSVDEVNETAKVLLKADSHFLPILRQGQEMTCSIYEIGLVDE